MYIYIYRLARRRYMRFTGLTVAVSRSNRVDRPVAVHSEPKRRETHGTIRDPPARFGGTPGLWQGPLLSYGGTVFTSWRQLRRGPSRIPHSW